METESRVESHNNNNFKFLTVHKFTSQFFPQCVKYLIKELAVYWCPLNCFRHNEVLVVKEGFIRYECEWLHFNMNMVDKSTPEDLDLFANCKFTDTDHMEFLALALKDRWYKGDFVRLKRILTMPDYMRLLRFVENCLWERSYEDNYTLGQQLSIRMTTNLIQSGLDFKHHVGNNAVIKNCRGWNSEEMEKIFANLNSVADITKRYKCSHVFVVLEIDTNNSQYAMELLNRHFDNVITNNYLDNVCAIRCTNSGIVLESLTPLYEHRLINLLFVTDTETYLHTNNLFYIYNSMKFYYYCLKNRFVFEYSDYETLYYIYTVVVLETINGGCLNSFTLEKSPVMHPLELNSRRCNALKRAAAYNKTIRSDMELKVDFIKGKRITTGTHNPNRIVEIKMKDYI
ncbi:P47 [Phthorimaea operculella granulovirus]|uniref:p47 n=1 Tax=Phthorimaea operculella granulovirus TaxID=192584 RepID=Q8JRZ8_9BBAC|nr:P47 [Phthorimaea operculella granulovirus]AAM70259.1 P47 [Phthorimaea operculella granulovirus]ANY57450.1 P47 [Phthorimaea operculella granulovirus]QBH65896.1 P47 [Phthorimaea operculella granulovirus]QBH66026.1 P47 [Phthorimaea operculella granulovirus]QBH66156.1 P47 [Phthorimaea operculella granulovirus]